MSDPAPAGTPAKLDPQPPSTTTGPIAHLPQGTRQVTIDVDKQKVLYIRPVRNPTVPAPALLLLPYQGGTPAAMAALTRAARLAADYGAWIILPSIPGGAQWEDDNPLAIGASSTHDIDYLKDVLNASAFSGMIDPGRVYIAGYSNSGFMAERFVCQSHVPIAGLALIAATDRGAIEQQGCTPAMPLREVGFNGTKDPYVRYEGIDGSTTYANYVLYSAKSTEKIWLSREACNTAATTESTLPVRHDDGTTVTLSANHQCARNTAVALYTINGGGHTWPGNPYGKYDAFYLGKTTQNLDATLALWTFFTGS